MSRTTLSIDDDVLGAAKSIAASEAISVGEAVSRLARRGLAPTAKPTGRSRNGLPTFDVPADAAIIAEEMVREALDEDW